MRFLDTIRVSSTSLGTAVDAVIAEYNTRKTLDGTLESVDSQILNVGEMFYVILVYSYNDARHDQPVAQRPQFIGMPFDADPKHPTTTS